MLSLFRRTFLLACLGLLSLSLRGAEVTVFAAVSLTDALKEIAAMHEQATGDKLVFNFAGSNLLARQIEEGAPADVFFSADEAKMDALEKKGLIVKETRRSRLGNSLVLVVPLDGAVPIRSIADLAESKIKHLALADPKAVPAGIYAQAYLEKTKLWSAVAAKVVPTENVRAALAAVEAGNAEAGIVYKTDAAISKKVKVALEIPATETPEISYPVAITKEARQAEGARKFLHTLESSAAAQVFEKYGFAVKK